MPSTLEASKPGRKNLYELAAEMDALVEGDSDRFLQIATVSLIDEQLKAQGNGMKLEKSTTTYHPEGAALDSKISFSVPFTPGEKEPLFQIFMSRKKSDGKLDVIWEGKSTLNIFKLNTSEDTTVRYRVDINWTSINQNPNDPSAEITLYLKNQATGELHSFSLSQPLLSDQQVARIKEGIRPISSVKELGVLVSDTKKLIDAIKTAYNNQKGLTLTSKIQIGRSNKTVAELNTIITENYYRLQEINKSLLVINPALVNAGIMVEIYEHHELMGNVKN